MSTAGGSGPEAAAVLAALPASVVVIDPVGTISYATAPAAALLERTPEDLVGTSVLALVSEETAWAYAAAVALATDYVDQIMGPLRVSVVTPSAKTLSADLWATNHLDNPEISGIVCLLTPESAASGLGAAIGALADRQPFTDVLALTTAALRGLPTDADAAVVAVTHDGSRQIVSTSQDPDIAAMFGAEGPWRAAALQDQRFLAADAGELPDGIATALRAAGYATLWVEPIGRAESRGALVVLRHSPGLPSPNELSTVHEAAAIAHLAWDRHDHPDADT